jgi:hypothetical protein
MRKTMMGGLGCGLAGWLNSSLIQIVAGVAAKTLVENPYTWLTKRYSVIFFGTLFIFWLLETRKKRFVDQNEL